MSDKSLLNTRTRKERAYALLRAKIKQVFLAQPTPLTLCTRTRTQIPGIDAERGQIQILCSHHVLIVF